MLRVRSWVHAAALMFGISVAAPQAVAKRAEHPVDFAKFAKDFAAHKEDLKLAGECVEQFRGEKDGGASMEDLPKPPHLAKYQECATKLRAAVTRYVKGSGSDAETIKSSITTPVGMALWLAWNLAEARLGAEDILITAEPHFRWVLVNDGNEREPTIPANIAAEMLQQVKDAAAAGKDEVKGLADDETFKALTLQDSGGKSWLGNLQSALNDQAISGHAYTFDDVMAASKMFANDHFSVWLQGQLPFATKLKGTDLPTTLLLMKRIDDLETVCTKDKATGYVNVTLSRDKLQASAVKKCVETGKVKASYWTGPFLATKAVGDFLKAQSTPGKRIAINCGRSEGTMRATAAVARASFADGFTIKPGGDPAVLMSQLPNKWVTPNRVDDAEVRFCVPAQVYVGPGTPDPKDHPRVDKLGKLVMFYGLDLTK